MGIVKVLKRKDASSVLVAVVLAFIIIQLLPAVTGRLAVNITGVEEGQTFSGAFPGAGWESVYLYPVVWAVLQVLALEILVWLYVGLHSLMLKKK